MTDAQDRRQEAEFNVRSKILAAIDQTDDKNQRNLLLLMFGVLETYENGIRRIETKIDAVLRDEAAIKTMALNGHAPKHHQHHDWVEQRIQAGCEDQCDWITKQKADVTAMKPVCDWAKRKMADEDEAARTKKTVIQKFFEGMSGNFGSLIAAAVVGWFVAQWVGR